MAKITYKYFIENILTKSNLNQKQLYWAYQQTDRWEFLRDERLELDNHRCRMCDAPATCVHHRKYPEVFGEETVDDLTSLCYQCHNNHHTPPSVKDVSIQVEELRKKSGGTTCPCCKQHVQEYTRKINAGMTKTLIEIYRVSKEREFQDGWFNVFQTMAENAFHTSHDWGGLKQWGILEQRPNRNPKVKEKRDSGQWRITTKGEQFVRGEIQVPKYVVLFNKQLLGYTGDPVSVKDCLTDKFNYEELMRGA